MKCTPDVSWGAPNAVSQMGNLYVHGYDAGVVKIDTFNNNANLIHLVDLVQYSTNKTPEGTRIAVYHHLTINSQLPPTIKVSHGRVDVFDYDNVLRIRGLIVSPSRSARSR